MTTLAQMWLIETLREEMGGTYSPITQRRRELRRSRGRSIRS